MENTHNENITALTNWANQLDKLISDSNRWPVDYKSLVIEVIMHIAIQ